MLDLIHLLHGSSDGLDKLVNNFQQHWSNKCSSNEAHPTLSGKGHISKRQLSKKIRAIAKKESRLFDKPRWYVLQSVLASYSLNNLKVESGVQEPNNRDISPPTAIKQLTTPTLEIHKPVALPVTNLSKETFSVNKIDGSQNRKSNSSTSKHRVILQTLIPASDVKKTTSMECYPHPVNNPLIQDKLPALLVANSTQSEQNIATQQHEMAVSNKVNLNKGASETTAAQMSTALHPGIHDSAAQVMPENTPHQMQNIIRPDEARAKNVQPIKSQSHYNGHNLKLCSQNAELQLITFKRQIPSPECSIRASKVLKLEDTSMNNHFHNFSGDSHQVLQGDDVGKLEVQQC